MKKLCNLSYAQLDKYDIISYYKLCAISKASGILVNRMKSIKRGHNTKDPRMKQPLLVSCYGFKVNNCLLKVPLGNRRYLDIPLNKHTKEVFTSNPNVRIKSFLITPTHVSICFAKDTGQYEPQHTIGIDRNLANCEVGNSQIITQYNLEKAVQITANSRSVIRAFRRNDVRVRRTLAQKHGKRRKNRIHQLLHKLSKAIVKHGKEQKAAIVLEDISYIRGLYLRGNYQGRNHRAKMNSWPYYELGRQIKYKASWEDVPIIQLSKSETRGTSQLCSLCGKRTQVAVKDDVQHKRQLWCEQCQRWQDRDVIAAVNISLKGLC